MKTSEPSSFSSNTSLDPTTLTADVETATASVGGAGVVRGVGEAASPSSASAGGAGKNTNNNTRRARVGAENRRPTSRKNWIVAGTAVVVILAIGLIVALSTSGGNRSNGNSDASQSTKTVTATATVDDEFADDNDVSATLIEDGMIDNNGIADANNNNNGSGVESIPSMEQPELTTNENDAAMTSSAPTTTSLPTKLPTTNSVGTSITSEPALPELSSETSAMFGKYELSDESAASYNDNNSTIYLSSSDPTSKLPDGTMELTRDESSSEPSSLPSDIPSSNPSTRPTQQSTSEPSEQQQQMYDEPSHQPISVEPTTQPVIQPALYQLFSSNEFDKWQQSLYAKSNPTQSPTKEPTSNPTITSPVNRPSLGPSQEQQPAIYQAFLSGDFQTLEPSTKPTKGQTTQPISIPTSNPTKSPEQQPALYNLFLTGDFQTMEPTTKPTVEPTIISKPTTQKPTTDNTINSHAIEKETYTSFYLIADTPYSANERENLMPAHISDLKPSEGEFLIHLGDLMYAKDCTSDTVGYNSAYNILKESPVPTFVLPGDNDINDCPDPIKDGEERWMRYMHKFDQQHWNHNLNLTRWGTLDESFAFVRKGVLYLAVNIVGGTPYSSLEKEERHALHLEKIRSILASLDADDYQVIVLLGHAAPGSFHNDFFDGFVTMVKATNKPVVHFHGDIHRYFEVEGNFFGYDKYMRISLDGRSVAPPLRVEIDIGKENPVKVSRRRNDLDVECCKDGWPRGTEF